MSKLKGFQTTVPKYRPVAVVDIGSNSVRMVVYDGLRRSPAPFFNEKLLCGLGKGVALTGRLNEEGMVRAIGALKRFSALARQIGAKETFAVATAAAREASNGEVFIDRAEIALNASIDVLTGKQEARYAALGVMAGVPDADGLVGDLGGGSLELVDVKDGRIRDGTTLKLGALRLIDVSGGSIERASQIVDEELAKADVIGRLEGRTFYAVGGTWRNLARLHMARSAYPLHVLHGYRIDSQQAQSLASLVAHLSPQSFKDMKAVSRNRAETLPFGALVLGRLLAIGKAAQVITSVYGVREGLLYSKLPRRKRELDALLASCWDFARRYARSPEHELELCDWTDQLFAAGALSETEAQKRLRHAACLLADIGWRAHPDYRAERSLGMISQAAFVGIDHPGRLFLALTIYFRYEGADGEGLSQGFARLIPAEDLERARLLSLALRLAYVLSAAMPGMLPKLKLSLSSGKILGLVFPRKLKDLNGERVEKRLASLAEAMGRVAQITVS